MSLGSNVYSIYFIFIHLVSFNCRLHLSNNIYSDILLEDTVHILPRCIRYYSYCIVYTNKMWHETIMKHMLKFKRYTLRSFGSTQVGLSNARKESPRPRAWVLLLLRLLSVTLWPCFVPLQSL